MNDKFGDSIIEIRYTYIQQNSKYIQGTFRLESANTFIIFVILGKVPENKTSISIKFLHTQVYLIK